MIFGLSFRYFFQVNRVLFGIFNPVVKVVLFLVSEGFAIANQELEITRVRLVDGWKVDFIDDAVAKREPGPSVGVIRGT